PSPFTVPSPTGCGAHVQGKSLTAHLLSVSTRPCSFAAAASSAGRSCSTAAAATARPYSTRAGRLRRSLTTGAPFSPGPEWTEKDASPADLRVEGKEEPRPHLIEEGEEEEVVGPSSAASARCSFTGQPPAAPTFGCPLSSVSIPSVSNT
ncbi:unnamed protein product, partial [Urochloa humidicola]